MFVHFEKIVFHSHEKKENDDFPKNLIRIAVRDTRVWRIVIENCSKLTLGTMTRNVRFLRFVVLEETIFFGTCQSRKIQHRRVFLFVMFYILKRGSVYFILFIC